MRNIGFLAALTACKGGAETDTVVDTDTDEVIDTDTSADMPANPAPFTVTVSGGLERTLVFDTPTCTVMGANFRAFWRNSAQEHVFVLIAETLGHYTEAGDYDSTLSNTRARLQEEAYGEGLGPFATDTASGDSFVLHVENLDPVSYTGIQRAWGTFDVNGMHGTDGTAITVSPTNLPIWCEAVNDG